APPSVDGDVRRLDADVTATHRLRDRARAVGGRSCGIRRNGVARRRPDSLVDVAATVRAARATRSRCEPRLTAVVRTRPTLLRGDGAGGGGDRPARDADRRGPGERVHPRAHARVLPAAPG